MYKTTANCPPERAVAKFYSNSCWKRLFHYLIMKITGTDESGTIFHWPKKIVGRSKMDIPKKAFLFISLIGIQIFKNKNTHTHTHKFHTNCFSLCYQEWEKCSKFHRVSLEALQVLGRRCSTNSGSLSWERLSSDCITEIRRTMHWQPGCNVETWFTSLQTNGQYILYNI